MKSPVEGQTYYINVIAKIDEANKDTDYFPYKPIEVKYKNQSLFSFFALGKHFYLSPYSVLLAIVMLALLCTALVTRIRKSQEESYRTAAQ